MKQKDITLIVMAAAFSTLLALGMSSFVFKSPNANPTKVQVIEPINEDFPKIDERYFNRLSINPTQTVEIGGNSNPKPFN